MKLKMVLAGVALAVGMVAVADGQIINLVKMRKAIMNTNGAASTLAVDMLRNPPRVPYDAAVAATIAKSIAHDNDIFPTLFPDSTKPDVFKPANKDDQTRAKPAVWTDNAGFKAASAKMVKDATAAADAAAKGADAFKTAWEVVAANCESCHQKYKVD
ncbi:MAG: cytochrome c [Bauldia sp.]